MLEVPQALQKLVFCYRDLYVMTVLTADCHWTLPSTVLTPTIVEGRPHHRQHGRGKTKDPADPAVSIMAGVCDFVDRHRTEFLQALATPEGVPQQSLCGSDDASNKGNLPAAHEPDP